MELNEMEKKLLFQVEGDYQTKILNELYMTVRYSNNSEQREAAEGLMAKLRVLSNAECMDLVKDIQKNYRLPYPARTIGEKIAEARQQSGAEKYYSGAYNPEAANRRRGRRKCYAFAEAHWLRGKSGFLS